MTLINIEELKAKISIAKKTVEYETDERFRIEAFKIILNNLIQKSLTSKEFQTAIPTSTKSTEGAKAKSQISNPIEQLATKCNISQEHLRNVFEFTKDKFVLLKEPNAETELEKQIKASVCILTAYKIGLDKEWNTATILTDAISERGISLNHFSKNIATRKDLIKKIGEKKGTKYGVTTKGFQEGTELIKSLSK